MQKTLNPIGGRGPDCAKLLEAGGSREIYPGQVRGLSMHDAPIFLSLLLSTVSRPRIAPANERETSEERIDDWTWERSTWETHACAGPRMRQRHSGAMIRNSFLGMLESSVRWIIMMCRRWKLKLWEDVKSRQECEGGGISGPCMRITRGKTGPGAR